MPVEPEPQHREIDCLGADQGLVAGGLGVQVGSVRVEGVDRGRLREERDQILLDHGVAPGRVTRRQAEELVEDEHLAVGEVAS